MGVCRGRPPCTGHARPGRPAGKARESNPTGERDPGWPRDSVHVEAPPPRPGEPAERGHAFGFRRLDNAPALPTETAPVQRPETAPPARPASPRPPSERAANDSEELKYTLESVQVRGQPTHANPGHSSLCPIPAWGQYRRERRRFHPGALPAPWDWFFQGRAVRPAQGQSPRTRPSRRRGRRTQHSRRQRHGDGNLCGRRRREVPPAPSPPTQGLTWPRPTCSVLA